MHRIPIRATAINRVAQVQSRNVLRTFSVQSSLNDVNVKNVPPPREDDEPPKKPWVLITTLTSCALLGAYYGYEKYKSATKTQQIVTKEQVPATEQQLREVTENVIPVLPHVKDSLEQVEHGTDAATKKQDDKHDRPHYLTHEELRKQKLAERKAENKDEHKPSTLEKKEEKVVEQAKEQSHQEERKEAEAVVNAEQTQQATQSIPEEPQVNTVQQPDVDNVEQPKPVQQNDSTLNEQQQQNDVEPKTQEEQEHNTTNETTPQEPTITTNVQQSSNESQKEPLTEQDELKYYQAAILDKLQQDTEKQSEQLYQDTQAFIADGLNNLTAQMKQVEESKQSIREEQLQRESELQQLSESKQHEEEQVTYLQKYNAQVKLSESLESQIARLKYLLESRESELITLRQSTFEEGQHLVQQAQSIIENQRQEMIHSQQDIINQTRSLLDDATNKYDTLTRQQQEQLQVNLDNAETRITRKFQRDSLSRIERLSQMTSKVYAAEYAFNTSSRYLNDALQVQQLTVANIALQYACNTSGPIQYELDAIKEYADGDELLKAVACSVPDVIAKKGAPLVTDLSDRFSRVVKKRALTAGIMPTGWGLPGYLYANVASRFIVEESGLVDGIHLNARLARAEYYLRSNNLALGIDELEKASHWSPDLEEVLRDWLMDAKSRLVVDQAVEAIQHHIVNLNISINH